MSATASSAAGWVDPWEMRLLRRFGLAPVSAGLLLALGLIAFYLAVESVFGRFGRVPFEQVAGQVFGVSIAAVLAGYSLAAGQAIARARRATLAELADVMHLPEADPGVRTQARWWGVAALAAAAGFLFLVDEAVGQMLRGVAFTSDALLSLLIVPLAFYLTVRVTFFTMAFLGALVDAARKSLRVDLLDTGRLAPLGRAGLQASLLFIGAAALTSLSVVLTGGSVPEYVAVGTLLATATAAFLYPMRGAAGRIRAAKRAALAEVRGEVRRDREAMTRGDAAAASRLPALLAYEARIERVSEWPLDASTLTRFVLLLLLPLLSWLGGALVERALDALL